jgi:hypothetical protein
VDDVLPIRQPAVEDLRNAQAIARMWADDSRWPETERQRLPAEVAEAFERIDALIGAALGKLGEPNAAAVEVAMLWLGNEPPDTVMWAEPEARDAAAAILRAALTT